MSNGNEKIISDIHEILVVYAQKGNKIWCWKYPYIETVPRYGQLHNEIK